MNNTLRRRYLRLAEQRRALARASFAAGDYTAASVAAVNALKVLGRIDAQTERTHAMRTELRSLRAAAEVLRTRV